MTASDPIVLEVFSDYVCPWCYLGENRIRNLPERLNITVKRVHFPLHPETPAEGRKLQDMFGVPAEEIAAKNTRMRGLMEADGLPYEDRSHTYNSRLAQEIGAWADSLGTEHGIHDAFFHAYFVDRLNIGDQDVILKIVADCGLDVDMATRVLNERLFKDAVDADWQKSHQYGVTGVPTFVAGGRGLVGAQPGEAVEQMLMSVGAAPREIGA
tara:strand:- start:2760 stop:3395 length:636 start_codon:yes stop_codon:yes gene_type:complete